MLARRSFWPSFFSSIVARLQWDAAAIDLAPDARAWAELPDERRRRLTTLLAGFHVGEDAVSEHLEPFANVARQSRMASAETLMAWVFYLQRRDEVRHAQLFDRIAAEVLGLPGTTPAERRAAARGHAPAAVLELFEERLPALAAELAAGHGGLDDGVAFYHMVLEGVVFDAGQRALLDDLADGALPGIHEGVRRVELDERWHIGFGLRCLMEARAIPGPARRAAGAGRGRRRGVGRRRSRRHAGAQREHVRPAAVGRRAHRAARGGVAGSSTRRARGPRPSRRR